MTRWADLWNWRRTRRALGEIRIVLVACAALIATTWIAVVAMSIGAQGTAERDAARDVATLGIVIGEQVTRTLAAIDQTLKFVAYEFLENPSPDRLAELVGAGVVPMDNLVLLGFVDANGILTQTERGPDKSALDLSDREHIRVHLDRRTDGLFVGKPVLGRASGRWSIQLSRAVREADGSLLGVIVAAMDPSYFERFWERAKLASTDRVELIGTDGVVRARNSESTQALMSGLQRPELPVIATNDGGHFRDHDSFDGVERLSYYKRLENLPLILTVGVDESVIAKAVASQQQAYIKLGAVATLAILLLGYLLSQRTLQLADERREADRARQRLRDAIEAIPEGFALYDSDDRLAVFNSAYRRAYATSAPFIREGTTFEELIREGAKRGQYPPAIGRLEEWVAERMQLHRTSPGPFEQQINNGRWLRIEERRTADGGVVGIRADITELKARENELARQSDLMTATFDHMSEGLTVVDANGNLIAWNRRFEQMFAAPAQLNGADREQEKGFVRTTEETDENWRLFAADAERLVQASCRMPGEALNHLASDGRTIEIKSSLMPHGGAVTIYTDVTERKRVDREMRAAREAAETADRAKSEFVAMISHELRTPMNGVLGLTSLLLDTKLDSTQMRYARAIDESGNRLLGLINEILDLFRLEAGRAELECAPFDLPALIKSVTDTTRVLVGDKPISVTARIENGVPRMLLGAGDRIYQILQNLLGNAAKFTERGAIELRVSCRASAEPLKLIRIEISDTGPGIPDEVQPRLFNAFEQGGPEIARRFGGTGLGLVICKRLVDLMGGRISFTSRVGVGTTFCVELSLPVTEETAAAAPMQGTALGTATRPLRVLVAEDTPASQMVVQAMLEKQGHSVHLVGNGREAVDAARRGGFDVVLMDLQMPVMDGLEAAGEIRALPAPLRDVPIVALTAQALPTDQARTSRAGMNYHLVKPIKAAQLENVLAKVAASTPRAGDDAAAAPNTAPPGEVVDDEALANLRRELGDSAFSAIARRFLIDSRDTLRNIDTALGARDGVALRRHAHRFAGLSGQFGLTQAAQLATETENALDDANLRGCARRLLVEAAAAVAEVERRLDLEPELLLRSANAPIPA